MSNNLRERLTEAIKRVPDGAVNGSYQVAVSYKAFYKKAEKYLKSGKTNEQELNALLNQYWGFK